MNSSLFLIFMTGIAVTMGNYFSNTVANRAVTGTTPTIRDCGSKVNIKRIELDQCDGLPCEVHYGQTATGRVTMEAKATTTSLTCKIVGKLPQVELPFNGCPVNACENLSTGDCPVKVKEMLVYEIKLPITKFYPTIEITGKWMLKDDAGENFLCFEIPIKIEA